MLLLILFFILKLFTWIDESDLWTEYRNHWLFAQCNECRPLDVFPVDSDQQTCATEQDGDKSSRPLILDVGENSVKISRAGKPRAPQETSSHGEMSS